MTNDQENGQLTNLPIINDQTEEALFIWLLEFG